MNKFIIVIFLLFISATSSGAAPVLNFSDINSGPKTGNSDGVGSGAIVTVWGNNLGSAQGTSHVYVGAVEATQIYYWKNADGELPGGPAELYSSHEMQEICFSVPGSAVDGSNTISVSVGEETSNTLPFTVRSGNIYFIKSSGNDSTGDGSWANPWLTCSNVMSGDGRLSAGDTVYSVGVDSTSGIRVGGVGAVAGTEASPISLIAYPNSSCDISGEGGNDCVIVNWSARGVYVNLSKLSVTARGNSGVECNGIKAFSHNRIVGVEITGPTVYGGYGGAITCSGDDNTEANGGKYLGIYMHDYGYRSTTPGLNNYSYVYQSDYTTWTNQPYDGIGDACTNCNSIDAKQHLYYLTIRKAATITDPYEIGWNNLVNNPILEGIHIYDMTVADSGFNGPLKIHHNVVKNQGGASFDVSLPYSAQYAKIDFWDNVIIVDDDIPWAGEAIRVYGDVDIKIWNNTIYGYRLGGVTTYGATVTWDIRNNIFFDTLGFSFFDFTPDAYSNNLFFSLQGTTVPSWFSAGNGDISEDPDFTDSINYDFTLQVGSPSINSGYDTALIVNTDFLNVIRDDETIDIGAYEYTSQTIYEQPTITGPVDSSTTNTSVEIEGTYTVDSELTVDTVTWTLGEASGFCVAALGTFTCTVPDLALGTNSIVFEITDSNSGTDSDTTVVTRTAPPSGNVIYTGSMSGGTYR